MKYEFSKRDHNNRATLTINGKKVGRVHFREYDAWIKPYRGCRLKSRRELESLGMTVIEDPGNEYYPVKVFVNTYQEEQVAALFEKAFLDLY